MDKALLQEKIDQARTDLTVASSHLDKVLGEIKVAPRAEKTGITEVVKEAFARLNAARAALDDLEDILGGGES